MMKNHILSAEALANVLDQSVDCVKLLDLAGSVLWLNSNGICAMEIDDFAQVQGQHWAEFWPEDTRAAVEDTLKTARTGETVRFEAFCPTAKGSPRWWHVTVNTVTAPGGEEAGFLAISRDVTEGKMQRRALAIAADEMQHRLKNAYAMACGMLRSFAIGNQQHEAFAREMSDRLNALSTAQSLFMARDMPRDICDFIPFLVQPFLIPASTADFDDVQSVQVSLSLANAVALIVGELAMNSSKHGAFFHGGTVAVSAHESEGRLNIRWYEISHQPVAAQSRPDGQGLTIIKRMVEAHQGTITTTWGSHGPVVETSLPITR